MAKATLASASLALATPFRTLNSGLSDLGLKVSFDCKANFESSGLRSSRQKLQTDVWP